MNFKDWYTDTVDIYRVVQSTEGALTVNARQLMYEGIPCRIYRDNAKPPQMSQTAASIDQSQKLACDNGVDIRAGDELIIHRGAVLGKAVFDNRAFAGEPHYHFEPFGAVIPGLAHQEIDLLQLERIDSLGGD